MNLILLASSNPKTLNSLSNGNPSQESSQFSFLMLSSPSLPYSHVILLHTCLSLYEARAEFSTTTETISKIFLKTFTNSPIIKWSPICTTLLAIRKVAAELGNFFSSPAITVVYREHLTESMKIVHDADLVFASIVNSPKSNRQLNAKGWHFCRGDFTESQGNLKIFVSFLPD